MLKCGCSENITNLQDEITSKVSSMANLSSTLGTPAGLASAKSLLAPSITSIKSKFENLVPAVPTVHKSLRNDLNEIVAGEIGSVDTLAKTAQFVQDYGEGLPDVNLNNLATTALTAAASPEGFSPCTSKVSMSPLAFIPNLVKNIETGVLEKLPLVAPKLGGKIPNEFPMGDLDKALHDIADNFNQNMGTNELLASADEIHETLDKIQQNIQPAMEDFVRVLPSGEEVLEMKEDLSNFLQDRVEMMSEMPLDEFGQGFPDIPFKIPNVPALDSFKGTKPQSLIDSLTQGLTGGLSGLTDSLSDLQGQATESATSAVQSIGI